MKKQKADATLTDMEREIARIDAGGDAWSEDDEVLEVEVKEPLDKVIPIRLSAAQWEQLRKEAKVVGVGPSTLARMWLLEKLRTKAKATS
ncbi:MAG: hypothetical protein HY681_12790 [Chloroflexi bacterium]|nr:hypothetical protein [Chloroflexota bacterium]